MSKKKKAPVVVVPPPEYVSTGTQYGVASWLRLRATMQAPLEPVPHDGLGGFREALRLERQRASFQTIVEVGPP